MFEQVFKNLQEKSPLVHSITNYVTVNDCANIILACGASPIMADDIEEVCDITAICSSLVINMGTLNSRTIAAMLSAGKQANTLNHPVVFDPVGVGASPLRNETAMQLLKEVRFSVIRGNISEIKFLATGNGNIKGVDAAVTDQVTPDNLDTVVALAQAFSKTTGAVIVITGAIDVVAAPHKAYRIHNGHPMMGRITGAGCMLTALIGSYIGANPDNILSATAAAVCAMGLCGELALPVAKGTGSYRTALMDCMSNLTLDQLKEGAKIASK